jgi:hypothetical protein
MKTLPFALLLAVAACAQWQNKEPLGREYGDATTHNMSVQVYDTGTVIEPESIETTAGF